MLQRKLFGKTLPCLSNLIRLGYANHFSDVPIKDENVQTETKNEVKEVANDNINNPTNVENLSKLLDEAATYTDATNNEWLTTPYPKEAVIKDQESKPIIVPSEKSILLFPGQGTIRVGTIGKYLKYPKVQELFDIASDILNYNLLKICLEGPQEKLNDTQFNQVATVVSSLAALEKLCEERPSVLENCVAAAGYSVGEITSLIFSGAMSYEDGIRLVNIRGRAMKYAADKVRQGMMSVYCTPKAKVSEACKNAQQWALHRGVENPVCLVAIYLYTQSKILAGNEEALQYIESNREKYFLSKLQRLPVSGAFHTPLMEPAIKSVARLLSTIELEEPRCTVYSNYKAVPYRNVKQMKKFILKQIVCPVKWEQCIQALYSRPPGTPFPRTFDVGSSGRMATILKLINAKASDSCIVV